MKRTILKLWNLILEIVFAISLVLLGKFDGNNLHLQAYQGVVCVFWICGVLVFMEKHNEAKKAMYDAAKDLFVALAVIPIWYFISGNREDDLYEPSSVLVHFAFLLIIIFVLIKPREKMLGKVAYLTNIIIPILSLFLIRMGVKIVFAMIIAVVVSEVINYLYYKRKNRNNKDSKENIEITKNKDYLELKKEQYGQVAREIEEVIKSCGYSSDEGSFSLAKKWMLNYERLPIHCIIVSVILEFMKDFARWIPIVVTFILGAFSQILSGNFSYILNKEFWLIALLVIAFGFSFEVALRAMYERTDKLRIRILESMTYEEFKTLIETEK